MVARFKLVLTHQAMKDLENLKKSGLEEQAKKLLEILQQDPYQEPPSYERLRKNLVGFLSRRIDRHHRLVYKVTEGKFTEDETDYEGLVKVERMWTHYHYDL